MKAVSVSGTVGASTALVLQEWCRVHTPPPPKVLSFPSLVPRIKQIWKISPDANAPEKRLQHHVAQLVLNKNHPY